MEIKEKGKAKIFLNPDIATDEIIAYIIEKLRLQHREVKVVADGSKHYGYSAEEERWENVLKYKSFYKDKIYSDCKLRKIA